MNSESQDFCLVLFTKPARPGRVKTRLIGALTPEQAATLHSAFLADVCVRLQAGAFHLRLAWALDDGQEVPRQPFAKAAGLDHVPQRGADLGDRLFLALQEAAEDYPFIAAVGSDHPELELATVEQAFERLEAGADVSIGPAADGGYYLIALRRAALRRELFTDIAWSTETVLAETLDKCAELGLTVERLKVGNDVDRPDDLRRLAARLRAHQGPACPQTSTLLASWNWLESLEEAP